MDHALGALVARFHQVVEVFILSRLSGAIPMAKWQPSLGDGMSFGKGLAVQLCEIKVAQCEKVKWRRRVAVLRRCAGDAIDRIPLFCTVHNTGTSSSPR